jgi:hypothetical protein
MVSMPPSSVTLGLTGALFIRVAGTGGISCAGSGWATTGLGAGFFRLAAFALVAGFACGTGAFGALEPCGVDCQATRPPDSIASAHSVAIVRFIAGSAFCATYLPRFYPVRGFPCTLFELFPLMDTQFRIGIYTAGCGIYSDGAMIVGETMILVEALKRRI